MGEPALRTVALSKRFGAVDALLPLDLEVGRGEVLGYLGPNGAGKTTTIRLILGLLRPTTGRAEIFGLDSVRRAVDAHRHLAYVPGETSLWPGLTGEETLHLLGRVHGSVDESYRDLLVERFVFDPSKKVRAYSKGNRQKLMLIAAFMCRPELLVLDEPTAGLDPLMEQAFRACVAEARGEGQSVFLSSHILSEVEALCDRVGILRAGQLVEIGTLSEMRHLSALSVEATFDGSPPDLTRVPGVTAVVVEGNRVRCQVHGSVEPLLKVLAAAGVHELLSHEPSLEELFLAHYGPSVEPSEVSVSLATPVLPARPVPAGRSPKTVVARLTARRASRQSILWGFVFGAIVVSTVSSFVTAYPTAADRLRLRASIAGNAGAEALLGPTRHIDTVVGWTAWRAVGLAMFIGAIWALLAGTRFLRGEEEAGRWELLLTGATTRGRAAAQALGGLGLALVAMFVVTAGITIVEGRSHDASFSTSSSVFLAVALVASSALFLVVGAFTSQLATTRRRAAGLAAGAFGVCFVLRMVAAAVSGLSWMHWVTPLGWIDELHPLTGSQPWALLPLVALIAVLAVATVRLAAARDLDAGILPAHDTAEARTGLLNGPASLAVRLVRGVALGWIGASAALALVMGLVARAASRSIEGSSSIKRILERLGGGNTSGAESYLGFAFLTVATVVALLAASQAHSTREEEAEGRLDNLLVRVVTCGRWLAGRTGVALVLIVATGVVSGFAAWVGAVVDGSDVSLGRLLEAGVNVLPPAVFVLGVGVLAFGLLPRLVTVVVYGIVVWSFLVELVGASVKTSQWLLDTSLFQHMKPVPAAAADWTSAAVMVAIGMVAAVVGGMAFARRDLSSA